MNANNYLIHLKRRDKEHIRLAYFFHMNYSMIIWNDYNLFCNEMMNNHIRQIFMFTFNYTYENIVISFFNKSAFNLKENSSFKINKNLLHSSQRK